MKVMHTVDGENVTHVVDEEGVMLIRVPKDIALADGAWFLTIEIEDAHPVEGSVRFVWAQHLIELTARVHNLEKHFSRELQTKGGSSPAQWRRLDEDVSFDEFGQIRR